MRISELETAVRSAVVGGIPVAQVVTGSEAVEAVKTLTGRIEELEYALTAARPENPWA